MKDLLQKAKKILANYSEPTASSEVTFTDTNKYDLAYAQLCTLIAIADELRKMNESDKVKD